MMDFSTVKEIASLLGVSSNDIMKHISNNYSEFIDQGMMEDDIGRPLLNGRAVTLLKMTLPSYVFGSGQRTDILDRL